MLTYDINIPTANQVATIPPNTTEIAKQLGNIANSINKQQLDALTTLLKQAGGELKVQVSQSTGTFLTLKIGQTEFQIKDPQILFKEGLAAFLQLKYSNLGKPEITLSQNTIFNTESKTIPQQIKLNEVQIDQKLPIESQTQKQLSQQIETKNNTTRNIIKEILKSIAPDLAPSVLLQAEQNIKNLIPNYISTNISKDIDSKANPFQAALEKLITPLILSKNDFKNSKMLTDSISKLITDGVKTLPQPQVTNEKIDGNIKELLATVKQTIINAPNYKINNTLESGSLEQIKDIVNRINRFIELKNSNLELDFSLNKQLYSTILREILTSTVKILSEGRNVNAGLKALDLILNQLEESVATPDGLKEFKKILERSGNNLNTTQIDKSEYRESKNPLAMIENLLQGQEAIRRISPLLAQVGEPMFFLIPGLLQGMLQNIEFTFHKPTVDSDSNKDKNRESYQRLTTVVTFPYLGKIKADIAYRLDHVLISLSTDSEKIADFLDQHIHLLKSGLNKLGFNRADLITRRDMHLECDRQPTWIRDAIRVKAIA